MLQGLANRFLGDFVEDKAIDRHLGLQDFAQMPTNGLSFAVFIRRQIEVFGVLQGGLQLPHLLCLLLRHDVDRLEILLDVDAQVGPILLLKLLGHLLGSLRKVANVANTGLNRVALPQKLGDCPRLGRRLDNH